MSHGNGAAQASISSARDSRQFPESRPRVVRLQGGKLRAVARTIAVMLRFAETVIKIFIATSSLFHTL